MSDLLHQNINSVGSDKSKAPVTIASAATVAPTTFLSLITGTTQIATITAPTTGHHMLMFVFTDASPGVFLTSGNVVTAIAPTQNVPVILVYDPIGAQYYGGELKTT